MHYVVVFYLRLCLNDVINDLRNTFSGCYVNNMFIDCVLCAEYIVVLAASYMTVFIPCWLLVMLQVRILNFMPNCKNSSYIAVGPRPQVAVANARQVT